MIMMAVGRFNSRGPRGQVSHDGRVRMIQREHLFDLISSLLFSDVISTTLLRKRTLNLPNRKTSPKRTKQQRFPNILKQPNHTPQ